MSPIGLPARGFRKQSVDFTGELRRGVIAVERFDEPALRIESAFIRAFHPVDTLRTYACGGLYPTWSGKQLTLPSRIVSGRD